MVGPQGAAAVRIRTGAATTEALAEVGRPAATVGGVVHLAAPPTTSARSAEVVAHELVHALRPSPVPRFFADDHDSSEEREATRTGNLVKSGLMSALGRRVDVASRARSSELPLGTTGLAVGPGASPLTAGALTELAALKLPAGAPPGPAGGHPGGPERIFGEAGDGSTDTSRSLHRRRGAGRHRIDGSDPTLPPALARLIDSPVTAGSGTEHTRHERGSSDGSRRPMFSGGPMSPPAPPLPLVERSSHPLSEETLDWIVEAVEERILAELERRGLRYQPGVF